MFITHSPSFSGNADCPQLFINIWFFVSLQYDFRISPPSLFFSEIDLILLSAFSFLKSSPSPSIFFHCIFFPHPMFTLLAQKKRIKLIYGCCVLQSRGEPWWIQELLLSYKLHPQAQDPFTVPWHYHRESAESPCTEDKCQR